jgi:DNA-directed RNA polymerase subunit beta
LNELRGRNLFGAKIIPARGVWIEIETDTDGTIIARIDRKRKFPITSLLRILGAETNEQILEIFKENEEAKKVIEFTLTKDHAKTTDESFIEIHKRLRDGDLATAENAREFIGDIFKSDRYDLVSCRPFPL